MKAGGGKSWAEEARVLSGLWESVVDSQGVSDAEDARNRALGEPQNASMEWQKAEVRCEGDRRIRPGMRVALKYVGERFSGEYVAERVEHEFGIDGFITEVHLRRNMLPGEPKRTSAIDEERERQYNGGGATEESAQENAEEQEEEKNPLIANPQWKNADGEPVTKALVGDEVYLCADVQDIDDGASAKIKVVEKDDDDADSEQEKDEKGYTLPEYAFTVECGATSAESAQLDVMGWIRTQFIDKKTGKPIFNRKYIVYLLDGTSIKGVTDENGYIDLRDLKFGKYIICL